MLERLLDKITDDGSAEFIYLIVGSLILYAFQRARDAFLRFRRRRHLKAELHAYRAGKEAINVLDIANGDPDFEKCNIIVREVSNLGRPKALFVNMPAEHKSKLRQREIEAGYSEQQYSQFHADQSFNGSADFSELARMTGIEKLAELIEKHRHLVADKYLDSAEGMLFNGLKYGVFNLRVTRFGENEAPGVELYLFRTDYFTHRVFRSIYHELKAANHPIARANVDNFLQYRPFFTSFGVNALLIAEGPKSKEIILSRRSARVHGGRARYHVTMNEGLSQTDKDPFGRVDLELCFKRGLLEELGISNDLYRLATRSAFYDFFLERTNLELGLSAVFELDVGFQTDVEPLIARDKTLEADSFTSIPLKAAPIQEFVSNNDFVPHGLYVIERVLLREGISICSTKKSTSC